MEPKQLFHSRVIVRLLLRLSSQMVRTGHADVFPKTAHARQSETSEEAEAEAQVAKSFTWGAGMRRAASIAAARHVAASTSAARQAKAASLHSALNGWADRSIKAQKLHFTIITNLMYLLYHSADTIFIA